MKQISFVIALIMTVFCTAIAADQGKPAISFSEKAYSFGNIQEANGPVTHVFKFTNTGNAPLVILEARASCGCTKPKFTAKPIEPGKSGELSVTFNPAGRPGEFTKTITVKTNDPKNKKLQLHIKGVVIPQK